MNTIQIKHGLNPPEDGDLEPFELGYCEKEKCLYIGLISDSGEKIVVKIK
jgi:hypothetical protein